MPVRRSLIWPFALAGAVLAAGCGSSSSNKASTQNPKTTAPAGATPSTAPSANALAEVTARGKPTVTVPKAPATKLELHDDVVGTGPVVKPHDTVTVHYVGDGQTNGKQFDASWDRNQPAQFSLDEVIPGWGQGLVGMRVGGRRTLVIPGDLAYGASPPPNSGINANETLVFVVDLISIP